MRNRFGGVSFGAMIARAPEGEGGTGGEGDKTPESVLFPDENKSADPPAGDDKSKEGEGDKPAAGDDWKEYENDPAKSEAENAAAKAEHDKTKPAGRDAKDKKDDPADKVPEDGKYALTMPEGVEVDQELLDALGPKFAAKKLTTREAQELADEFIKVQQARGAKQAETWSNTVAKWADDAKADKEIGGAKWDGTVSNAQRAVKMLGTPALADYLNATGGGNHPELIRFMAKVGSMIKEDTPASSGAGGAGKPVETAHILFKNDAPKGT